MTRPQFYVGADIAADTLATSVFTAEQGLIATQEQLQNSLDGFQMLVRWLGEHGITPETTVVCIEATGVYSEAFCHFFVATGYHLAVEPALKVKRAFKPAGRRTDPVDSQQIAEYAYRFYDQLSFWHPPSDIVEQVRALLALRERVTKSLVIHKNAYRSLQRKPVRIEFAEDMTTDLIGTLNQKLAAIDAEIERLIKQDPTLHQLVRHLDMIPGIGLLLASYYLVMTNGFVTGLCYRSQAAYLGIAPLQRQSGTLSRRPRSRQYGPQNIRKLLHLAARSVCVHNKQFREYYQRKLLQGKSEQLVYNNVSNKLLKILCALVRTGKPYIPGYCSLNPALQHVA